MYAVISQYCERKARALFSQNRKLISGDFEKTLKLKTKKTELLWAAYYKVCSKISKHIAESRPGNDNVGYLCYNYNTEFILHTESSPNPLDTQNLNIRLQKGGIKHCKKSQYMKENWTYQCKKNKNISIWPYCFSIIHGSVKDVWMFLCSMNPVLCVKAWGTLICVILWSEDAV